MNRGYNRVEWNFLQDLMLRMGFSNQWTSRIMDILRVTRFSVIINGQPSNFFTPYWGLRQGCPLSPHLFLFCTQGLSSLIKIRVSSGDFIGIWCHRNAPTITHLFLAMILYFLGKLIMLLMWIFKRFVRFMKRPRANWLISTNLVSLSTQTHPLTCKRCISPL